MDTPEIEPLLIWPLEVAKTQHVHSVKLAEEISKILSPHKPVIDMGCGLGFYLGHLKYNGFQHLTGLEGTPGIEEISDFKPIQEQDLSQSFDLGFKGNVICLEVAEHLLPEQENTLVSNILQHLDGRLIISWAVPGQGGDGHHNCQDNYYVWWLFCAQHGLSFNAKETFWLRCNVDEETHWFKNTLFVFEKTS